MAVSARTKVILASKAGGRCSYTGCEETLAQDNDGAEGPIVVGDVAHIIAQKRDGARGEAPLPMSRRDDYDNLIYLCPNHHKLIDKPQEVARHPVHKLLQMKEDHERWVSERLSSRLRFTGVREPEGQVQEYVPSTLLPVQHIPPYVYGAPCKLKPGEVKARIVYPKARGAALPFIIRENTLYTFCDLRSPVNPFVKSIDPAAAGQHDAPKWWGDEDKMRWYVQLLNRTLNKLTGRLGLRLDREHSRYYFQPLEEWEVQRADPARLPDGFNDLDEDIQRDVERFRSIVSKTTTGRRSTRLVAYRPTFRRDGSYKKYWEHLAVGLRFHYIGEMSWVLSLRPGRQFSRNGEMSLTGKGTGRRSTSKASHMYNGDVLSDTHFWKEFLSRERRTSRAPRPRISVDLLDQKLLIDCAPVEVELDWPGVPDDARPYDYIKSEEDLFSIAELHGESDDEGSADGWAPTKAWT